MDNNFISGKLIIKKKHLALNHLIIKPFKVLAKNLAHYSGLFIKAINKGYGFNFLVLLTKNLRVF